MELYLLQHGLAKSEEEDPERGLSPKGRDETERIAKQLKGRVHTPVEIWHSGKKRAEETATILAGAFGSESTIKQHPRLAPNDPIDPVQKEIDDFQGILMISGHLPYLSRLLSALLNLPEDQSPVQFRNSAVVCLNKVEGLWKIRWILHPDLISYSDYP